MIFGCHDPILATFNLVWCKTKLFMNNWFRNCSSVQQFFTLVPEQTPFSILDATFFLPACYFFCLGWVFYIWNPCVHALLLWVFYAKKVSTPFAPYEIYNFTATYIGCTSSFCLLALRFSKIFYSIKNKKKTGIYQLSYKFN